MRIEDKLEIVIPTFNRCEKLGVTFSYLLGENSPVKNCDITILDNCSTDDTPNLVKKIAEKHPNVRYRRNGRNVGIVANIARSAEIAKRRYLWTIGDDDTYDWTCWGEVEEAIENEAHVIIVGYAGCPKVSFEDPRVWAIMPGGCDILGVSIFDVSFLDDSIYSDSFDMESSNIFCAIAVLYCNKIPHLKVICVSRDIVLTFETEAVWNRIDGNTVRPRETRLNFCALFLKEKKLLDRCIKTEVRCIAFNLVASLYGGVFLKRLKHPRSLVALALFPWKYKIYLLIIGHWKLAKRAMQKLANLDFKIRSGF